MGWREKSGDDPSRLPYILWPKGKGYFALKFPSCIQCASGKFSGNQRIFLFTNFPLHINKGKLDKEIFCLPLNFPLTYHMHEGNLEDRINFTLAWAMREIRGLNSLGKQESEAIIVNSPFHEQNNMHAVNHTCERFCACELHTQIIMTGTI